MVLPTLQSYAAIKRLSTPQLDNETDKKTERAPIRVNSAQSKWASPISGILKDEALREEQEKQEKSKRLDQRRSHLSEVLETERSKYQSEITGMRQSSREKDRPIIPDDKFEVHSMDQLKLEDDFQPDDRHEEERQTDRQIRIVQLKIILEKQMNELKQKEDESHLLKQEEESLLTEQHQLEEYQQQRQQMQKPPVQQESSRQLLRQHKAKLHKHAKEIQEQLEFDMNILASIVHGNGETRLNQFDDQDNFRRDARKLLQQFEQAMQLEKVREEELNGMYPDEAAKQWSHREQQWTHEQKSREKFLDELLHNRQEQIANRLEMIEKHSEELEEKQRMLIHDMEQARKYQLIEKQKHTRELEENKPSPRISSGIRQQPIVEDLPTKPIISKTTIEPKFFGRRRVNWN